MNSVAAYDLHDIQGNIVKAYSRDRMPRGRYVFFAVKQGRAGRTFLDGLMPMITSSAHAKRIAGDSSRAPRVATNVALTFDGLRALGVPQASLQSFPDEFAMGMRARRTLLGDDGASALEHWDPIWRSAHRVHILVLIHGETDAVIDERYRAILDLLRPLNGGVELLSGHRGDGGASDLPYQQASSLFIDGRYSANEHFGYRDSISNPYFRGVEGHPSNVMGGGKVTGRDVDTQEGWAPLETGEFLLGYRDEASELPDAPLPPLLAQNGTYLVYRKLHQNVGSFDAYLEDVGKDYPGGKEALAAKMCGRWRNGAPVTTFRTEREASEFAAEWEDARRSIATAATGGEREAAKAVFSELNRKFVAYDYRKDVDGSGCPFGAHTRRTQPRSSLEFGESKTFATPDALSLRRRLLRRGITYGESGSNRTDDGNHGLIFMAFCASLQRQFEFVQQQWVNYGNDFKCGNDKDPIAGNQGRDAAGAATGRMTIEASNDNPDAPFFCSRLPRFVETRGGDYFFVPGMTALGMIAEGVVDPT
jgi:Dyp-type peroxidase family